MSPPIAKRRRVEPSDRKLRSSRHAAADNKPSPQQQVEIEHLKLNDDDDSFTLSAINIEELLFEFEKNNNEMYIDVDFSRELAILQNEIEMPLNVTPTMESELLPIITEEQKITTSENETTTPLSDEPEIELTTTHSEAEPISEPIVPDDDAVMMNIILNVAPMGRREQSCMLCARKYKNSGSLRNHLKKEHNEEVVDDSYAGGCGLFAEIPGRGRPRKKVVNTGVAVDQFKKAQLHVEYLEHLKRGNNSTWMITGKSLYTSCLNIPSEPIYMKFSELQYNYTLSLKEKSWDKKIQSKINKFCNGVNVDGIAIHHASNLFRSTLLLALERTNSHLIINFSDVEMVDIATHFLHHLIGVFMREILRIITPFLLESYDLDKFLETITTFIFTFELEHLSAQKMIMPDYFLKKNNLELLNSNELIIGYELLPTGLLQSSAYIEYARILCSYPDATYSSLSIIKAVVDNSDYMLALKEFIIRCFLELSIDIVHDFQSKLHLANIKGIIVTNTSFLILTQAKIIETLKRSSIPLFTSYKHSSTTKQHTLVDINNGII
jgi:hypothetical protein